MGNRPHYKLLVWQRSMELAVELYRLPRRFPTEEKYGMISQIQRAAVSIPVNIAEGSARRNVKEFLHFLSIAKGSVSELDTELLICNRVNLLREDDYLCLSEKLEEISKTLHGLIRYLNSKLKADK